MHSEDVAVPSEGKAVALNYISGPVHNSAAAPLSHSQRIVTGTGIIRGEPANSLLVERGETNKIDSSSAPAPIIGSLVEAMSLRTSSSQCV